MSFASGMCGLAGPLHGLANQEVIRWILDMKKHLGKGKLTKEEIEKYIRQTLAEGKVVPGYGHAVLRKTDPRFLAQMEFAKEHCPDDELVNIVWNVYEVAPKILGESGKIKNPWPNVDAHSGSLLVHYGLEEYDFYTVLFRCISCPRCTRLSHLGSGAWSRIERPKSVTTEWMKEYVAKKEAPKKEAPVTTD
jgi:citrate synthase